MKHIFELTNGGWLLKNAPETYQPCYYAFTAAHDILEHMRDDDGSVVAELFALGRLLFVRAEANYWINYVRDSHINSEIYKLHRMLDNDITGLYESLFNYYDFYNINNNTALLPYIAPQPKLGDFLEEELDLLKDELLRDQWLWDDVDTSYRWKLALVNRTLDYLRAGYKHAKHVRYRGHFASDVSEYFYRVTQALEPHFPGDEIYGDLIVQTNFRKLTVRTYRQFDY